MTPCRSGAEREAPDGPVHPRGLTFDVTETGPPTAGLSSCCTASPRIVTAGTAWRRRSPTPAIGSWRRISAATPPGPGRAGRRSYTLDRLAGDVLALADAAGADRFDVVGHDWGAAVAWYLAGVHPDRVRSLTALSVPHPRAFAEAMLRSRQPLRSWYMLVFQVPKLPELALSPAGAAGSRICCSASVSMSTRPAGTPDGPPPPAP